MVVYCVMVECSDPWYPDNLVGIYATREAAQRYLDARRAEIIANGDEEWIEEIMTRYSICENAVQS